VLPKRRRIISIETDLLKIQSDIVRERRAVFRGPPLEPEEESASSTPSLPLVVDLEQKEEGLDREDLQRPAYVGPRLDLLLSSLEQR
jgi:hypothetical protein